MHSTYKSKGEFLILMRHLSALPSDRFKITLREKWKMINFSVC